MARQSFTPSIGKKLDSDLLGRGVGTLDEYYLTEDERGESADLLQVYTEVDTAKGMATTAQNTADGAQDTASDALSLAATADGKASTALTNANTALSTANTAATSATAAQTTATNAQNTADSAGATATGAASAATSAYNLASTANNAATSAAAAAAAAQTSANNAATSATNAQNTATAASTAAAAAQTTANTANTNALQASNDAATANTTASAASTAASNAQTTATNAATTATNAAAAADAAQTTANTAITGLSGKQDKLVSGTNIKTINDTTLLGSGNINIPVSPSTDADNAITSGSDSKPFLSKWTLGSVRLGEFDSGDSAYNFNAVPEQSYGYIRYIHPTNNPTNTPVTHTANTGYRLEWCPVYGTNTGTMLLTVSTETETILYKRTRYNNAWITAYIAIDKEIPAGGTKWQIIEKNSSADRDVGWVGARMSELTVSMPQRTTGNTEVAYDMVMGSVNSLGATVTSGKFVVPVTGVYDIQFNGRPDFTNTGGQYGVVAYMLKHGTTEKSRAEGNLFQDLYIGLNVVKADLGIYLTEGQQLGFSCYYYNGTLAAHTATVRFVLRR